MSEAEQPEVADVPCPKCGGTNVRMIWQDKDLPSRHEHLYCVDQVEPTELVEVEKWGDTYLMLPEHFHRSCQRCHYWWPTFDVLPEPPITIEAGKAYFAMLRTLSAADDIAAQEAINRSEREWEHTRVAERVLDDVRAGN